MLSLSRRKAALLGLLLATAPGWFPISAVGADKAPLAIKGYDPVAYFLLGRAERGLPEFEYEWEELRYRFITAEHRELFKEQPVRFAPQFANLCAMALTRGETVESNPEHWLIRDGKLYLFGKSVGPDLFRTDMQSNIDKATQHHQGTTRNQGTMRKQ